MLRVELHPDTKPLKVSSELMDCMTDSPVAEKKFRSLPHSHQMYYSNWIESAKTVRTKAKRIGLTILAMEKNLSYAGVPKGV